jgi:hypothetical protein
MAAVWAGDEVLLWGGKGIERGTVTLASGASFVPATGKWQLLPKSPLSARSGAEAVWTGSLVIVLGGAPLFGFPADADGAVYDPRSRAWSMLPAFPRPSPGDPASVVGVWTGSQLLVWTTYQVVKSTTEPHGVINTRFSARVVAASWVPGARSWHVLPGPPTYAYTNEAQAVWTGRDVIFVGGENCLPSESCMPGPEPGAIYVPASGTWRALPVNAVIAWPGPVAWTGTTLVVMSYAGVASPFPNGTASAGQGRLVGGDGRWEPMPQAPEGPVGATMAWTGHELLLWGLGAQGHSIAEALLPAQPAHRP